MNNGEVKMFIGGGNGQWVRARNEEGAKAFMREREMEAERLQAAHIRSREFWGAFRRSIVRRARSLWQRLRR